MFSMRWDASTGEMALHRISIVGPHALAMTINVTRYYDLDPNLDMRRQ